MIGNEKIFVPDPLPAVATGLERLYARCCVNAKRFVFMIIPQNRTFANAGQNGAGILKVLPSSSGSRPPVSSRRLTAHSFSARVFFSRFHCLSP